MDVQTYWSAVIRQDAQAMHSIQVKSILSARNGMNLYRGCQHGCIYCDSRSRCYQMEHPFEDIAVKENGPELLEAALRRKRKPCMIGTGSMSDPYIPLEMELGLTRKSLELIEKYGFGVTMITKSDRILRDLDILKQINERTKAVVQMTLTTMEEGLCRILEPGVCTTARRIEVLKMLQEAEIPTVVWMCPILPFLNDTEENIRGIVRACAGAGVKGIIHFGMGMTLREGSREYYYAALDRHFPGLKEQYIRTYGNRYEINSPKNAELMKLFHNTCEKAGILHDIRQIFTYLHAFEDKELLDQASFFD